MVDLLPLDNQLPSYKFQPTWEKLRSRATWVLVGSLTFVMFRNVFVYACTGIPTNSTACPRLNTAYVAGQCLHDLNFIILYPRISLTLSGLLLIGNDFWLYIPRVGIKVRRCVEEFNKVFKKFDEKVGIDFDERKRLLSNAKTFLLIYEVRHYFSIACSLLVYGGFWWLTIIVSPIVLAEHSCKINVKQNGPTPGQDSCNFSCIFVNSHVFVVVIIIQSLAILALIYVSGVVFSVLTPRFCGYCRKQKPLAIEELCKMMEIDEERIKRFKDFLLQGYGATRETRSSTV